MKWDKVPVEKLQEPPLIVEDFLSVIAKSKPSVGLDEISQYGEWTEEFGSGHRRIIDISL